MLQIFTKIKHINAAHSVTAANEACDPGSLCADFRWTTFGDCSMKPILYLIGFVLLVLWLAFVQPHVGF